MHLMLYNYTWAQAATQSDKKLQQKNTTFTRTTEFNKNNNRVRVKTTSISISETSSAQIFDYVNIFSEVR